ncbi:hypothetical protein OQA88_3646 [Cercophora sp. LCS_1]
MSKRKNAGTSQEDKSPSKTTQEKQSVKTTKASNPTDLSAASFSSISSITSSSSERSRSVGSEDSASVATNITTPDLSDCETKPAAATATKKIILKQGKKAEPAAPQTSSAHVSPPTSVSAPVAAPAPATTSTGPAAGSGLVTKKKRSREEKSALEGETTAAPASKKLKTTSPPACTPAVSKSLATASSALPNGAQLRPKEYFETRVSEMLDDPLDFDDLVYDEKRPKKAQQIFKTFSRWRKWQGPPIDVCMSGAVSVDEKENKDRGKSPKGAREEEELTKGVLKKNHLKRIDDQVRAGKKRQMEEGLKSPKSPGMLVKSPKVILKSPITPKSVAKSPKRMKGVPMGSWEDEEGGILVGVVPKERKKYVPKSPGRSPRAGGRRTRSRR